VDTVGSRIIGVVTVAALLATAGLAAAQEPSFSVTVEPQGEAGTLSPGEETSVEVSVRLEGDDFSCAENEELPVNVTTNDPRGLTVSADPQELIFSGTQGIHDADGPSGGYNKSKPTSISLQVGQTASSGDREVTVTGTFPGGNYGPPEGSCGGEFPPADDTAGLPVTIQADGASGSDSGGEGGDGGEGGNGTSGGGDDGGGEGGNGIPIGPWVGPLALATSALAWRRR
jgi:uncharacterized membrane protein YgcG